MIKKPADYNHTYERNQSVALQTNFCFKIFLLKMEKNDKFSLNYHRHMVQPLVLRILRFLSENINGKKFLPRGGLLPPQQVEYCPHVYKNCTRSYYCYYK